MSKNNKPTQFYATMSTTIVLVLISLFLLLFLHSTNITNIVKENINILVELEDGLPSGEIENLRTIISKYDGVKANSVIYLDKAAALAMMSKELNISDVVSENPFHDIIKFNLTQQAYSEANIINIKTQIELEKGVAGLYYENESVDFVKGNLDKVSLGILVLALCFVILAIAIIFNTIQLTLYSDIKEIKTMQMVGAENSFIKKPYLKSAFMMALKSTFIVVFIIGIATTYLIYTQNIIAEIIQIKYVILAFVLTAIIAFIMQVYTTNLIINRFLRRERR